MKSFYILLLLVVLQSYYLPVHTVLITGTLFPDVAGKKVYLFGDNHTSAYKQHDLSQLYAFQQQVHTLNGTTHIYCEVPCNIYYLVNNSPKVTASLISYINSITSRPLSVPEIPQIMPDRPDTNSANLVAQNIEIRGPAVAADFLLSQTTMLNYKLEELPFTTNTTTFSLATLTFADTLNYADMLEQQVKDQHAQLFGTQHTDMLRITCTISQENRQKLLEQLQTLELDCTSSVLEASRLLVSQSKQEQRQELLVTMHNFIDPLFRLALLHKIYTAPAEKVIVCAGYNHTQVLAYYLAELGFTEQSSVDSRIYPGFDESTLVPLDPVYCTF